ncbi:T9SS type A sorting domain-containing protein [Flavobacterium sp. UW10123]|uniref:T9SS type A sorting domain-containing protein n=1 Tax=Flavobacterium sp. UW10123 TaxID=3230800 RepID=UPI00339A6951
MAKIKFVLILFLINSICNGQINNSSERIGVCTDLTYQYGSSIISDGDGGAIVFWKDERERDKPELGGYSIFAQRITKDGTIKWKKDGIRVCSRTLTNYGPIVIPDGKGGAIFAWEYTGEDSYGYDVHAQRINGDGILQWTLDGATVCKMVGAQQKIQLASNGNGGAIITWYDSRNTNEKAIYAQNLNFDGSVKWIENGVLLSKTYDVDTDFKIISDGNKGAIIAWTDNNNPNLKRGMYAQRIDSDGKKLWNEEGVYIKTKGGSAYNPSLVTDSGNGAIISWEHRIDTGIAINISMQRLDDNGVIKWGENAVPIFDLDVSQGKESRMVSDDNGGAIITWKDGRVNTINYPNIYVQRVNAEGIPKWVKNGIAITNYQYTSSDTPRIAKDGAGGAIISWDQRDFGTAVMIQSINAAGEMLWNASDKPIGEMGFGSNIISDEVGTAIIAWNYSVSTHNIDVYAKKISLKKNLSIDEHVNVANPYVRIFPNPVHSFLTLDSAENFKSLSIINQNGQIISTFKGDVKKVDFSSLPSGVYFMDILTAKGKIIKKVIKY